jgi:hypothetical protein
MRAVLLALLVPACGGGKNPPADEPTSVVPIEASCVLGTDGANCTFTNKGQTAGSRCFKVLYGNKDSGTVVSSDKVCSPKLAGGAVAAVAVRFPRRPADACGIDAGKCTVKVIDPDAAEAVAAAWQDELKSPGAGPLSDVECKRAGEHVFELTLEDAKKNADSDEDRKRVEEFMKENRDRVIEEMAKACLERLTRPQYDCVLKAKTTDEMRACERAQ